MVSAVLETNKISAAFPYKKQRRRVLGSEIAYVEDGRGRPHCAAAWQFHLVVPLAQCVAAAARPLHRPRPDRHGQLRQATR
jgi:hypothetical protein